MDDDIINVVLVMDDDAVWSVVSVIDFRVATMLLFCCFDSPVAVLLCPSVVVCESLLGDTNVDILTLLLLVLELLVVVLVVKDMFVKVEFPVSLFALDANQFISCRWCWASASSSIAFYSFARQQN